MSDVVFAIERPWKAARLLCFGLPLPIVRLKRQPFF